MTDPMQAIVEEAREEIIDGLVSGYTPKDEATVDRIITTAIERAMAAGASMSAIEVCKTIVNFEEFGGIPTVARLVDAYAAAAVERACEGAIYHCDQGIRRAENFLSGLRAAGSANPTWVMIHAIQADIREARAVLNPKEPPGQGDE